jgi:glycosyltransferase involved in cell wall biosynthesis
VTTKDIRFSIVIPAFNEAAYLGQTLMALQRQDFAGAVEIIVVDNNSTDGTAAVAAEFDVRVVHEPRPGVCWARQRGTEEAHGEIVISTDADTVQPPDWLSKIDRTFRDRDDCVAVASPCRFRPAPLWARIYPRLLFGLVYALFLISRRVWYGSATNIAFRRTAWSGYDTTLTQGGDELDLLRRLRRRGRVVFDPSNVVTTSARRLRHGLVYNVFVTLLFYYVLGYWLNRLFSRTVLRMAPAFRQERPKRRVSRLAFGLPIALAVLVFLDLR